jgi:hypothetical protein
MIGTKEHYEVLTHFEKCFNFLRLDREKDKSIWKLGYVYENGETNQAYKAFIKGYAFGKMTDFL